MNTKLYSNKNIFFQDENFCFQKIGNLIYFSTQEFQKVYNIFNLAHYRYEQNLLFFEISCENDVDFSENVLVFYRQRNFIPKIAKNNLLLKKKIVITDKTYDFLSSFAYENFQISCNLHTTITNLTIAYNINKMKQTLYNKNKDGKIISWTIELEKNKYRTITGQENGKKVTSNWTVCEGKNITKSNATSPYEQASKEVMAKILKQKEKGYVEEIEKINDVSEEEAMLAFEFQKFGKDIPEDELIAIQPKLDGLRMLANNELKSRNHKSFVSTPHILKSVKSLNCLYTLDGEAYNHELKEDFNKLISLVKQSKPKQEDFDKSEKLVQYHCYDILMPGNFKVRNEYLKKLLLDSDNKEKYPYIKYVPTIWCYKSEVDTWWKYFTKLGYEGIMIRRNKEYEGDRSRNLLKYKKFKDAEFEIVDILEGVGNRSKMMGKVVLKIGDKTFGANAKGDHAYYKELLDNKQDYIGKMATVKYQNLTPDGIPRFGIMIAIRDYE